MTGTPSELYFPSRSATASLRGYVYQALVTGLRWIRLEPGEILVCEGDEDLDRLLLDGTWEGEQIKALAGRVTARSRSVRDSVMWFARIFAARAANNQRCRWMFTTTAGLTTSREPNTPDLARWNEPEERGIIVAYIREVAPDAAARINELALWDQFVQSVAWQFDAPPVDVTRGLLQAEIGTRWSGLPRELAEARLLAAVLGASIEPDVGLRVLDREGLAELERAIRDGLEEWARDTALPAMLDQVLAGEVRRAISLAAAEERHRRLRSVLRTMVQSPPAAPIPSDLLRSEAGVVPFSGRDPELAALDEWLDGDTQLCLVWGPGGAGKTRLLIEWCKRLRLAGTPAGFLESDAAASALFDADGLRVAVIDYAEARLEQVEELLLQLANHDEVRIVLVAREPGEWWATLGERRYQSRRLVVQGRQIQVGVWARTHDDRERRFVEAVQAFSAALGHDEPEPPSPPAAFDDPLLLHIAALLAVLGEVPATEAELLDSVVEHELRFWSRAIDEFESSPAIARAAKRRAPRLAGLLSLAGPTQVDRIHELVEAAMEPDSVRVSIECVRALYAGENEIVRALGPDLMQERLAQEVVAAWPEAVAHVQDFGAGLNAWTVLARRAARIRDGSWLDPLLRRVPPEHSVVMDVARSVGWGLPDAVARVLLAGEDPETASEWLAALPERSIALAPVREAAMRLLLEAATADGRAEDVGRLAHDLAVHLWGTIGAVDEPLALAELSIEAYSQNATPTSGPLGLILATVLKAELVDRQGHSLEAEANLARAVAILRGWHANPTIGEYARGSHFVGALKSLAAIRSRGPTPSTALDPAREAVERARELDDPAILALALTTLDIVLGRLDRHREAADCAVEAAECLQRLAATQPDAFTVEHAQALSNLVGPLVNSGRAVDAEQAAARAVAQLRPVASIWPQRFAGALASTLGNHAVVLLRLRRGVEAQRAAAEAIDILRQLQPTHSFQLASCLQNTATVLKAVGDREGALTTLNEAVALLRNGAPDQSGELTRTLASALINLSAVAPSDAALDAADEAVRLIEGLSHEPECGVDVTLARALMNRSVVREATGDRSGAIDDTERAVSGLRSAFRRSPAAYAEDLAMSLSGLGVRLRDSERSAEALAVSIEAVDVAREAFGREPTLVVLLARSLVNLSGRLTEHGQHEAAAERSAEAVRLLSDVRGEGPNSAVGETLAAACFNHGLNAAQLGLHEDAARASETAFTIRLQRLAAYPSERQSALDALGNAIQMYRAAGLADDADRLAALIRAASAGDSATNGS